jgi:hypothetical protein
VPAVVIVAVGAGAVMMLTGKTNEVLRSSANQGSTDGALAMSQDAFAGYPGQRGSVTVNAFASSGGTQVAVGNADGHPAIWRRTASGTWSLVSASSSAVYARPGIENLTGITHGPAGWIAVGDVSSGARQHPVVVTSADGVTWQVIDTMSAFSSPDLYVHGVTASRNGYAVVGSQVTGKHTFAAMWWSADLRNWIRGDNDQGGKLDGRVTSSAVYSVVTTPVGFAAVGFHGDCHTIWTTQDGRAWKMYDVPKPVGTEHPMLNTIAANGNNVVASGYTLTRAGKVPLVVASSDGGGHWRQMLLSAPGGLGTVTALTAAGNGFVAAGQAGPAGAQHAVTWSTPNGMTWSAATPAGKGVQRITALSAVGHTVTGTSQKGTDPSVVTFPAP